MFPFKSVGQVGNVWTFGMNAGIDFNKNPPESISTSINTLEGCASVCDGNGQLLFYTDGGSVWDRNHNLMLNGRDLPGVGRNITGTTSQGALIVPVSGKSNQYYVFSLGGDADEVSDPSVYFGWLYYSIVDMSLNNGLGDVLIPHKGILLDTMLTEHMTAVSGNHCDVWLLVLPRFDTLFKAYKIDFNGIHNKPSLSTRVPGAGTYGYVGFYGNIDVAPDRKKIAIAQGNLVLYDFDPDSGSLSHPILLGDEPELGYYGVCFSPDNSKIYASASFRLYQYDLSSGNSSKIIESKFLLSAQGSGAYYAMKRGPDGKIYCAPFLSGLDLNVIEKPNVGGSSCKLNNHGFPLKLGTFCKAGLPNSIAQIIVKVQKTYRSETDTAYCTDSFTITATDSTGMNYIWNNSNAGNTQLIFTSGTYWVQYQKKSQDCADVFDEYVDTFHVFFDNSTKLVDSSWVLTSVCPTDTFILNPSIETGSDYTWEDDSHQIPRSVNQPGTSQLSYKIDSLCEVHKETFVVIYPETEVAFTADTLVCLMDTIIFNNWSTPSFNRFAWTFGDLNADTVIHPQHAYDKAGIYEVVLIGTIDGRCMDTARITIVVDTPLMSSFLASPDSICSGEKTYFKHNLQGITINSLNWDWGDDQEVSESLAEHIEHAYDRAGKMVVTFTANFRACPASIFKDTVYVYDLPLVSLGLDSGLCLNGPPIALHNLKSNPGQTNRFLWSTGDTTASIRVVYPGRYSLMVTQDPLGCSNTEVVTIFKGCFLDIPNTFSPNEDGTNDYFFPRALLSRNISKFKMQVLDRWGQVVFETTQTNGRGWDGKFNDINQPQGAYIYLIEAAVSGQPPERYHGNVTLIR